jgi:hypothetical protein
MKMSVGREKEIKEERKREKWIKENWRETD